MLIDLLLSGKDVVIFGGGKEATFKVKKVLDDNPKLIVISRTFSDEIREIAKNNSINLIEFDLGGDLSGLKGKIQNLDVAIVATDNADLNMKVSDFAREFDALVCVVDTPDLCDFAMPAIAKLGDIRVGISTNGKSPAMAAVIRRRIESTITETDLLHIKLQEHVRQIGKHHIENFDDRKKVLYKIIDDRRIDDLLREKKFEEAKVLAENMIMEVR